MKLKNTLLVFFLAVLFISCKQNKSTLQIQKPFKDIPKGLSIPFKPGLAPKNKIIHKGIFSPDLSAYFYTLSNKDFTHFDIHVIDYQMGGWTDPKKSFFNSEHDDHGMSFSPDGNTFYFSSTRPKNQGSKNQTWNIWKSDKINGNWSLPQIIDIPNLYGKQISHPSVTVSGDLYFHSSNPDYSEMHLYKSSLVNGKHGNAEKINFNDYQEKGECTPFVSPNEDYLLFAAIGNELNLMISLNDENGGWQKPKALSKAINTKGQGNPYVTPDNHFLLYTTGGNTDYKWEVKYVKFDSVMIN